MIKHNLFYTIVAMLIITLVTFLLNTLVFLPATRGKHLLESNHIVSAEVYCNGRPHKFTHSQQSHLSELINQSQLEEELKPFQSTPLNFEKIIIERFKNSPIELYPLGLVDDRLEFQVIGLEKNFYLIEKESASFQTTLNICSPHA